MVGDLAKLQRSRRVAIVKLSELCREKKKKQLAVCGSRLSPVPADMPQHISRCTAQHSSKKGSIVMLYNFG